MFNVHSVPIRWFPLEITRVIQSTEMPSNLLTQVVLCTAVRYVMWFGKAFSLPGISFWCIYEKFASNSLQIFFLSSFCHWHQCKVKGKIPPNQKYTHWALPGVKVTLWVACKKEFDCVHFIFKSSIIANVFCNNRMRLPFQKSQTIYIWKEGLSLSTLRIKEFPRVLEKDKLDRTNEYCGSAVEVMCCEEKYSICDLR